jgi:hypothetical protein
MSLGLGVPSFLYKLLDVKDVVSCYRQLVI